VGAALSVPQLARIVGLSSSRLQHLFKSQTGTCLTAYVYEGRFRKAVQLLKVEGMSLKEIADRLGYHNSTSFSRAFMRRFGVPPAHWRSSRRC